MTDTLSRFDFRGHEVRTMVIDGDPWFVAGDLCAALGLPTGAGSGRWLLGHGIIKKKPVTRRTHPELFAGSKAQSATLISKGSFYKIVVRSDRPEAKRLHTWVNRVVMPALRKDAAPVPVPVASETHVVSGEPSEDELIFKAIEVMRRRMDRLAAEKVKTQAIIDGLLSYMTVAG